MSSATFNKKQLKDALTAALKHVSSLPVRPIMGTLLFKLSTEEEKPYYNVVGFDLKEYAVAKLPFEGDIDCPSFCLTSPTKVKTLITKSKDKTIKFSFEEGKVIIHLGKGTYEFPCYDADEYPAAPSGEKDFAVYISTEDLKQAWAFTEFGYKKVEDFSALTGVNLRAEGNKLSFYAADGHVGGWFHCEQHEAKDEELKANITIPPALFKSLVQSDVVRFSFSNALVTGTPYRVDKDGESTSSIECGGMLNSSPYPNIEQMLAPAKVANTEVFTVSLEELEDCLSRIELVLNEAARHIIWDFSDGESEIRSPAIESIGYGAESLAIKGDELPDFTMGLNLKYLFGAVKVFKSLKATDITFSVNAAAPSLVFLSQEGIDGGCFIMVTNKL